MALTCCPNQFSMSLLVVIHRFDRGLRWHSTIHGGSLTAIASPSVGRKICMNLDSKMEIKRSNGNFDFESIYMNRFKNIDYGRQPPPDVCGLVNIADVLNMLQFDRKLQACDFIQKVSIFLF